MKKIGLIILVVCIANISFAQCDSLPIKIPERVFGNTSEINLLYSQLLDSLLFVTKTDYVLTSNNTKTSNKYGRFGKEFYGRQYAVGVMADGKLWLGATVAQPWIDEPTIQAFADSLRPSISLFAYRQLNTPFFTQQHTNTLEKINDHLSVLALTKHQRAGNWWQETLLPSIGRLVLLYNAEEESQGKLTIQKYYCKVTPTWIDNEATFKNPISIKGKCIGGAFFYEKFNTGILQLWLGGIITSTDNTTLKLTKINEQQKFNTDSADSTNR